MGRGKSVRTSMFTVPRLSTTIAKRSLEPRFYTDEGIQQEQPKKVIDLSTPPSIVLGPKRVGLLERLLQRGRVRKSEYSFSELQTKTNFPDLVHTEVDCLDEAELRNKFPKQGVRHKFFASGSYRFDFVLPSDSDNVVVAQISWNGKTRMP
jgi:hypothetical protein